MHPLSQVGQLWPGCQGGSVLVLSVLLAELVSADKPRVLLFPMIRWEVSRGGELCCAACPEPVARCP